MSPQKTRPDDSFLNFPVNTSMSPTHGDNLSYSTGTNQWTNTPGTSTGTLDGRYLKLDASKTTHYLNTTTGTASATSIANRGDVVKTIIRAECAYL